MDSPPHPSSSHRGNASSALELGPGLTFFDSAPLASVLSDSSLGSEKLSLAQRRERGRVSALYSEYALQYLRCSEEISTLEVEDS